MALARTLEAMCFKSSTGAAGSPAAAQRILNARDKTDPQAFGDGRPCWAEGQTKPYSDRCFARVPFGSRRAGEADEVRGLWMGDHLQEVMGCGNRFWEGHD